MVYIKNPYNKNCIIDKRLQILATIYKLALHCENQLLKISPFMQLVEVALHLLF